jgi:Tripartite tricarboxylate transporter family receptor
VLQKFQQRGQKYRLPDIVHEKIERSRARQRIERVICRKPGKQRVECFTRCIGETRAKRGGLKAVLTPGEQRFAPGISVDVAARTLAEGVAKRWNQPVVVENRPGADTMIGTQAFLDMRDSHALLFTTHSTFTVVPLLRAKVGYDPVGDVQPISLAVEDFLSVVVSPKLEIGSLAEFVALARKTPTELNFYAVPGAPYLAYLAFQQRAGVNTTFVAYNNPVGAVSDLSEGRIHIAVMPLASVLGAVHAEKVRLVAVTNAMRSPAAPGGADRRRIGIPRFYLRRLPRIVRCQGYASAPA